MNDLIKKMLAAGLALSAPQTGNIKISSPFRKHTHDEERDKKWFASQKASKRRAYIRESGHLEFDLIQDIGQYFAAPRLWVLVTYESPNHIKIIPIYRGKCPYVEQPQTDEAVFTIVERCIVMGGIDINAVEKWLWEQSANKGLTNV